MSNQLPSVILATTHNRSDTSRQCIEELENVGLTWPIHRGCPDHHDRQSPRGLLISGYRALQQFFAATVIAHRTQGYRLRRNSRITLTYYDTAARHQAPFNDRTRLLAYL